MQFDFVTAVIFGVLAFAAFHLYQHFRAGVATEEEDDLAVNQRQDVLQAIKSMQEDKED